MLVHLLSTPTLARADAYDGKPKLVIILVFDQFRGDYLDRYRSEFKAPNGWNLFLNQGAHFTDCYYEYANLITAAGHATIGTGAYTDGHQIPVNEWWQTYPDGTVQKVSSIDDPRYSIVGDAGPDPKSIGASPYKEMATTLGDELVLASGSRSRVYGVSLKDRAAILTSGHATQAAFWTDHETGHWITSTYWMKRLPSWVEGVNHSDAASEARRKSGAGAGEFYSKVGGTPAGVAYQFDFAKALIKSEKLGNNAAGVTDMLTLSISSTDISGHVVGPDDPAQRRLIVSSDALLSDFFSFIDKEVGLQNVLIALTGDHGVATTQKDADRMGMPALAMDTKLFMPPLEKALEDRFQKRKADYVLGLAYPYIQLNRAAFEAAGINESNAEDAAREELTRIFDSFSSTEKNLDHRVAQTPVLSHVYTSTEMRTGRLPATQYGHLIANSYSPLVGWALHVNYGPYQFPGTSGTTHFTGNSYDRHVPLDLFGPQVIPGTYHGLVAPVDIAATFASVLRINRPSAAVGRVLTEALKPEPNASRTHHVQPKGR